MNDTFQEIDAALGVAVLRRIVTATYRSGLPASAPDAARGSYGAAIALARGEGSTGTGLAAAARIRVRPRRAAQHGRGGLTALVGAVVGLLVLARRPAPVDQAASM